MEKFIQILEFSTEVLIEAQTQANNFLNDFSQNIENTPEGSCRLSRNSIKILNKNIFYLERANLTEEFSAISIFCKIFGKILKFLNQVKKFSSSVGKDFSTRPQTYRTYKLFEPLSKLFNF